MYNFVSFFERNFKLVDIQRVPHLFRLCICMQLGCTVQYARKCIKPNVIPPYIEENILFDYLLLVKRAVPRTEIQGKRL